MTDNTMALPALIECSQLYEKLVDEYPDRYNEEFAYALDVHYGCLIDARRSEEAVEIEQKAAMVRATRPKARPCWSVICTGAC